MIRMKIYMRRYKHRIANDMIEYRYEMNRNKTPQKRARIKYRVTYSKYLVVSFAKLF